MLYDIVLLYSVRYAYASPQAFPKLISTYLVYNSEGFNDWGGRGYDDFVPGELIKTAPSGDRTT